MMTVTRVTMEAKQKNRPKNKSEIQDWALYTSRGEQKLDAYKPIDS